MVSLFKMKKNDEFPFAYARRISPSEVIAAEQAIQEQFGINYTRRGRPVKSGTEKYQSVSIRLHPQVITWAYLW
ncbi:AT hook motif protein [Dolichospermum sp. ST_con]|nr:AT hook motif protein [Dolichospermum sp. ST_con]MDD1418975.1 AT hook motif protein [Dolichospermum sp. ST_sed1]MDD1423313.1 AT hook motif protein [Dolichospermum sp. ST_sed9]MDD1431232.1 AT hook motif protein [Dolichospermum sp. ST_sed6]MDD1435348.1 AT hook motif protein [Dolichospermum sp. ST_sed10]MDD1441298.1 AT hook motif protein [Dolichospermum sp. ST_sed3]MDD1445025.1 AT hook motif protein [Dolichospermum sp. ST_sed8]MDD1454667.1 AT hook motif protein [Dolichospermum sp. ST_sed7]M